MVSLALACAAIGLAPAVLWPALARAAAAWNPAWSQSPPSGSLWALGTCNLALALAAVAGTSLLWRRIRRRGLRRAPTWNCGYAAPTPRMQYTSGSFAATITEWFSWILRPEHNIHLPSETFPEHASFEEHTPETVLDKVARPAAEAVIRLAAIARKLQHGRVQAYLFYIVAGLVLLGAIVLKGGSR
jgi:hydrogenase-4 component B